MKKRRGKKRLKTRIETKSNIIDSLANAQHTFLSFGVHASYSFLNQARNINWMSLDVVCTIILLRFNKFVHFQLLCNVYIMLVTQRRREIVYSWNQGFCISMNCIVLIRLFDSALPNFVYSSSYIYYIWLYHFLTLCAGTPFNAFSVTSRQLNFGRK